jgi:cytochrome b
MTELTSHPVWDRSTRWFHWINFLCVVALSAVGLVILNEKALGLGNAGKIALKTLHVWIGYVFATNLAWRLVWAFIGNPYARWRALLPWGRGYLRDLGAYVRATFAGAPPHYRGRSPASRLAATVLIAALLVQAVTGLVLAGTDVFMPPFGSRIAAWIAAPGVDPATLVPYAPETYDQTAFEAMRAFRKPFVNVHLWNFYLLMGLVVAHVAAVVFVELKGGGVIGAMFTGRKILPGRPVDE